MGEDEESDELEIGQITERDSPDRITRPPNDELIEYDRGNKRNEVSSLGGEIAGGMGEVQYGRSKRVYALYIVIAILCVSTIFLYSGVNNLGNRIDCINQSLTEQIGEMKENSNSIDELKNDLGMLLPLNSNGTVSLDKSVYIINDTATVTVVDRDRNCKTWRIEKVNVVVRNTNTSKQISLTLTETGLDTGIFAETFTLANKTNNMERMIGVGINDTIEVLYDDEKTEDNRPANRIDNATIKQEEP